jgi:mono/diheme cytochrome c family protein
MRNDASHDLQNEVPCMKSIACFLIAVSGAWCLGLALARAQLAQASQPQSQTESQRLIGSVEGPDLFRAYCASCHGTDGKGSGPAAAALRTKPPDLTTINRRSGGKFPSQRVREIIAGDNRIAAHGSREMPIWGPIFHQVERDRDWGYVRLENLTKYLESIQSK